MEVAIITAEEMIKRIKETNGKIMIGNPNMDILKRRNLK